MTAAKHTQQQQQEERRNNNKTIKVAVAGNPNSGKSTLINGIAGTRLQVGNWPGVTVEKKQALFEYNNQQINLIDLPGTYSLSPYSMEEIVARDFLINDKPDIIINVVDSTNLERNLYLTIQLLELGIPVVIALNMHDEAQQKGYKINNMLLQEILGVKAIPTVANKGIGLGELIQSVLELNEQKVNRNPKVLTYNNDIESARDSIEQLIKPLYPDLVQQHPLRWLGFKIMEADSYIIEKLDLTDIEYDLDQALAHLKTGHDEDIESVMADARYGLASGLTREILKKPKLKKTELTERIDKVVLNKYLGIPVFLVAMWLTFKLTFDLANPFVDWLDGSVKGALVNWAGYLMNFTGIDWLSSLVIEGVIEGVGTVLVFLPVIFAIMFFITLLEGSGYMARAAFVMDRVMHALGLHGKSFIPLLMGFGCNVASIYAARTLENQRDRILTGMVAPLMSCGARLPVYILLAASFFAHNQGTIIFSLYLLGILMAVVAGMIFKRTLFKGEAPSFIMELPPYRMPSLKSLLIHTWDKGKHFLVKAGTYILAAAIIIWFLQNIPWGADKKDTVLGYLGLGVAYLTQPLGFGSVRDDSNPDTASSKPHWQAGAALISGIVAKELIVSTMGQVYGSEKAQQADSATLISFTDDVKDIGIGFVTATKQAVLNVFTTPLPVTAEDDTNDSLRASLKGLYTPLSAYAFMAFVLLYMPCFIVLIAMKHEFGTWKWVGVSVLYQTILAWLLAFIIYQGGTLLGLGG